MTLLINKNFKTMALFGVVVFFMSCTNDIADSAGGVIDNDSFKRVRLNLDLDGKITTKNVGEEHLKPLRTDLLTKHLLGDYKNAEFGTVNSGFVAQITSTNYPVKRTNALGATDVVSSDVKAFLEIPLPLALKASNVPDEYGLTDVLGDIETTFSFRVSTFTTYLERFNVDGAVRAYFSDGTNNSGFKQNLGTITELGTLSDYQFKDLYTQKEDRLSIQIPLDKYDFKTNFLDKFSGESIASSEELKTLFKGIKFDITKVSGQGLMTSFDVSDSKLKISYKNTYKVEGKEITENKELSFGLGDVVYNNFSHDHMGEMNANKAYIQGAGGYVTHVDISEFITENSTKFKDENWLINQASLKIYVDKDRFNKDTSLTKLYIYSYKNKDEISFISEAKVNNVTNKDYPFVKFFITTAMKDALERQDITALLIRSESSIIKLNTTTAKGIVLENDTTSETKAPELEVIYSKIK